MISISTKMLYRNEVSRQKFFGVKAKSGKVKVKKHGQPDGGSKCPKSDVTDMYSF